MLHYKKIFLSLIIMCCTSYLNAQKAYVPDPSPLIQQKLEEWQDLKFGLLMHWGPYSQWGIVESWSICPEDLSWAENAQRKGVATNYYDYVKTYEKLALTFNPSKFDPDKWAAAAKNAGMKYVIFTTKHHDGFCMFDTKQTNYKVTDSSCPYSSNTQPDITKSIMDAFAKQHFWKGLYFSKPDWHSPDYWWNKFPQSDRFASYSIEKYPHKWQKFKNFTFAQLKELSSNYGNIDILWLDGGWVQKFDSAQVTEMLLEKYEGSRWARNPQSQDINMDSIVTELRKIQPKMIVVDRAVPGKNQNYLTPEQHIPAEGLNYPWESCVTMGNSWSYVPNDVYKPTKKLVHMLIDIVSKGGNFLLNIGPSPIGEFADTAYDRLQGIGNWLHINGEAIYNTRKYKVFEEGSAIRYTQTKNGKIVYVFVLDDKIDKLNLLKTPNKPILSVTALSVNKQLKFEQKNEALSLTIPVAATENDKIARVYKIEYKQ